MEKKKSNFGGPESEQKNSHCEHHTWFGRLVSLPQQILKVGFFHSPSNYSRLDHFLKCGSSTVFMAMSRLHPALCVLPLNSHVLLYGVHLEISLVLPCEFLLCQLFPHPRPRKHQISSFESERSRFEEKDCFHNPNPTLSRILHMEGFYEVDF